MAGGGVDVVGLFVFNGGVSFFFLCFSFACMFFHFVCDWIFLCWDVSFLSPPSCSLLYERILGFKAS